jgi:hypothetical protein
MSLRDRIELAGRRPDSIRVRGALDGLAVVLESHFRHEERTLTDALTHLGLAIPR